MATGHGIAQISLYDYRNWGEYWRLTDQTLSKLFSKNGYWCDMNIQSYGNVKTAAAMLYGLSVEDLIGNDFAENDVQYPLLLTVSARKAEHQ